MTWIQTYTGRQFFPLDPRPDDIVIEDIAHALAHMCRFNGHVKHMWSVAEHCLLVSALLPDELQFAGLMHDAAEAYVSDVTRPLKMTAPHFAEAEDRLLHMMSEKWGFPFPFPPEVKHADNQALVIEANHLMSPPTLNWCDAVEIGIEDIAETSHHWPTFAYPRSPAEVRLEFLWVFNDLSKEM